MRFKTIIVILMSLLLAFSALSSQAGISDEDEDQNGNGQVDENETDPHNADTDGDGLWDGVEPRYGTDPTNYDSDGDGLNDGMEIKVGSDPRNPDTDGDGLLDGQEVQGDDADWCYTGTDTLKRDSDGDGIGDYFDDEDNDGLPNGAEYRRNPLTDLPIGWCNPLDPDTDGDTVPDGAEVYGNSYNKDQTSDPRKKDTDGDALLDDIDPHTWVWDHLPFSRIRGVECPSLVTKGVPFRVEGHVEYNTTAGANWRRIDGPMHVQVFIIQGDEAHAVSDIYTTGSYGRFAIFVTIGDEVKAGNAILEIRVTPFRGHIDYLPSVWSD